MAVVAAVVIMVNRVGGSQVFFDVVGRFQAERLIQDAKAKMAVLDSLMLDTISGIADSFGEIGSEIDALIEATVPLAKELGFARVEFQKFMEQAEGLEEIEAQIIDLGHAYGFSGREALAAGSKMAQLSAILGGGEATVAATEMGIAFGMISGMETRDAMTRLINLQQQTQFMYGELNAAQFENLSTRDKANQITANTVEVMNQLNTIENRSAATMSQLTFVMNQFAAQADLAGDSIAEMAAMSAVLIEAGEEQGKAGRALRMVYARIGADTNGAATALHTLGIETKNSDGSLRSLTDIMGELSVVSQHMTEDQKMSIAQLMAGNNHYVRLLKLMNNHERATELTQMSLEDQATAQDEVNRVMESASMQYKIATSELETMRAELGEALLPAMTRATNKQKDFTAAFKDLATAPVYGDLVTGIVGLRAGLGDTVGAMFRMGVNAMALNVALRTSSILIKSIYKDEQAIVYAQAYGMDRTREKYATQATLNVLKKEEAMLTATYNSLELSNAGVIQNKVLAEQSLLMAKEAVMNKQKQILTHEQFVLQTANQATQNVKNRVAALEAENITLAKISSIDKIRVNVASVKVRQNLVENQQKQAALQLELDLMRAEQNAIFTLAQARAQELPSLQSKLLILEGVKGATEAEIHLAQKQLGLTQNTQSLSAQTNNTRRAIRVIEKDVTAQKIIQLNTIKQEVAMGTRQLTQLQSHSEGSKLFNMVLHQQKVHKSDLVRLNEILSQAELKLINAKKQALPIEQHLAATENIRKETQKQLSGALVRTTISEHQLADAMQKTGLSSAVANAQQDAMYKNMLRNRQISMGMTGALGAMSMAYGLFGDSQESARKSMILMNIAMAPMMFSMVRDTFIKDANAAAGARVAAANIAVGETSRFAATGMGKFMIASGIGLAVFVLVEALDALFFANEKINDSFTQSVDIFNKLSPEELRDTFEEMSDVTYEEITNSVEDLSEQIDLNKRIMEDATEVEKALIQDKIDLLEEERDKLLQIGAIKRGQALTDKFTADRENIEAIVALQDLYERFDEGGLGGDSLIGSDVVDKINELQRLGLLEEGVFSGDQAALLAGGAGANLSLGLVDSPVKLFKDLLGDDYAEVMELLMRPGIDSYEDLIAFVESQGTLDEIMAPEESMNNITAVGDEIDEITQKLYEFDNAREELFYGFAAGNVTGDMIKQVTQKGVDTLIANTEVIMNNRFMGMTTEQAAAQIIAQIEGQLGVRGINLSTQQ